MPRIKNQVNDWTAISDCYDKATDLFTSLQTNVCAKKALKEAHTNQTTGCPNCDLYFYCAGNFKAMECKDSLLSLLGIGDKEKTIKYYNLCIEEAYLRGTQKSYDAKLAGKSGTSIDACTLFLKPEGCNLDPNKPSNDDKVC